MYPRGRIVEFTNREEGFCDSFILIPGMTIMSNTFQGIVYFIFLIYLFLGISIISDIFMEAIEVITSQKRVFHHKDENGIMVQKTVNVWNPTVANLTLMALGSSAPEILLNVIQCASELDSVPGELGPATIVGSAAFNFLVITGVSVAAVSYDDDDRLEEWLKEDDVDRGVKKVDAVGVFATTGTFSIIAYLWMWYVLSDSVVSLLEACITIGFMFALAFIAFAFDKLNSAKKDKLMQEKLGDTSLATGMQAVDHTAFTPPIPFSAHEVYEHLIPEESGTVWSNEQDKKKSAEMKNFLQKQFGTTSVRDIELAELKKVLEGEPLMKRTMYRKMNAVAQSRPAIKKGEKYRKEHVMAANYDKSQRNLQWGFKCTHLSVSEANHVATVTIENKQGIAG